MLLRGLYFGSQQKNIIYFPCFFYYYNLYNLFLIIIIIPLFLFLLLKIWLIVENLVN